MAIYTADAVAILVYLVDALPERVDQIFAAAEAGETAIQIPSTAFAEVLYAVSRDKDVRGTVLEGSPEDVRAAVIDDGPFVLAPIDNETFVEYADLVGEFTIHDGLVVASHRAHGTDAILTSDGPIAGAGIDTVWQ